MGKKTIQVKLIKNVYNLVLNPILILVTKIMTFKRQHKKYMLYVIFVVNNQNLKIKLSNLR